MTQRPKLARKRTARATVADAHVGILYHDVKVGLFEHGYYCRIPLEHVAIDADGSPNA